MDIKPTGVTRRNALLVAGAGLLSIRARAQDHAMSHGQGGASPYAGLSAGACTADALTCANSVTPFVDAQGNLWLAWCSGGDVGVSRSQDLGRTFDSHTRIAQHGDHLDAGPDARAQLLIDGEGRITVAYAFFKDEHWNAQVRVACSVDGGGTFTAPQPICADSASQRFPVLSLMPDGQVFAAWVDKRLASREQAEGRKREGASIAGAWAPHAGVGFGADRVLVEASCECCRIAVAVGPGGQPTLVYRGLFPGFVRDHASLTLLAGPGTPVQHRVADDQWLTHACPHHGPACAYSASGVLHAAWFTLGATRQGVFYAASHDDGAHYSEPLRVGRADRLAGRPTLLALPSGLWLGWKEFDGHQVTVWVQKSDDEGATWGAPRLLADATGYSDHPLLVAHAGRAYMSWLSRQRGYQLIALEEGA